MWYYVQNGQQAGPVSQEDLTESLRTGAVQPNTLVWRNGMGNWLPANEVAELSAGAAAPSDPANPSSVYAPGQSALQQAASPYATQWAAPRTNPLAIWSLVLSLVGLLLCGAFAAILALPAVICGHNARKQIRESGGGRREAAWL